MKTLPPMTLKERYYSAIEREIQRIFNEFIYAPLLHVLGEEVRNSRNALLEAIARGTVYYEGGEFRGAFNSGIVRELRRLGATFTSGRTWRISPGDVPPEVKFAQNAANSHFNQVRQKLLSTLDGMQVHTLKESERIAGSYDWTLTQMEGDFQRTLPPVPANEGHKDGVSARSRIAIEAKLTDAQKERIADEWTGNLDLYIKNWAQENIIKLREQIAPHVLAGGRAQGLEKMIRDNHGVSTRKAKFLARQETALLMSKFQETRYADIGIKKYRWSDSHDVRVRHDHHELNGKVFSFDAPPISNRKTGARNNPGQDFNCRCIAIPVYD